MEIRLTTPKHFQSKMEFSGYIPEYMLQGLVRLSDNDADAVLEGFLSDIAAILVVRSGPMNPERAQCMAKRLATLFEYAESRHSRSMQSAFQSFKEATNADPALSMLEQVHDAETQARDWLKLIADKSKEAPDV
jgi:hypothetical protein